MKIFKIPWKIFYYLSQDRSDCQDAVSLCMELCGLKNPGWKGIWQHLIKFKICIDTYIDKDATWCAVFRGNVSQQGNVINQL